MKSYRNELQELLGIGLSDTKSTESVQIKERKDKPEVVERSRPVRLLTKKTFNLEDRNVDEDIAIIGVSGKYPQAKDVAEYWANLRSGKDCINEIPKDRWDYTPYYDEDKSKKGKVYSKWGGFIDGMKQFDPLFFNISPKEAELMDPQERLFLTSVYELLEDAGYTPEELRKNSSILGNVGVYVGVMYSEYQLYGAEQQSKGRPLALSSSASSIANRISYYFNLHGPSIALDTMCSSSLTAIHLACESIKNGGCNVAIAGGVNLSLHPNKYFLLSQGKFVSSNGRCESFGEGGDGYVPGEGVGSVMLKKLSQAIADGDQIYGVIKGTDVNHGGKTNGYTVPNPTSQSEVIGRVLEKTGINPRTISYVEAHGTGTSLGDPIEITGLTQAFRKYTDDRQFCAIGSAKSNIGHCESAAGIAGLTKVLMQMKHGEIAPSLHSQTLNPYIDFESTPFEVPQEVREWKRPILEIDGVSKEYPRRAGLSSFGAGGANAHVIIEEYQPFEETEVVWSNNQTPYMIILSAKNNEQLKEKARSLKDAIRSNKYTERDLPSIAYTLQIGREAMDYRLGMVVPNLDQLVDNLEVFLKGDTDIDDFYVGTTKGSNEGISILANDEDMTQIIDLWVNKGKYAKLLQFWVRGFHVDWEILYQNDKPARISLPTYPFAKEEYWIPNHEETRSSSNHKNGTVHPLVHANTSDILGQRFSSQFTGSETFFKPGIEEKEHILMNEAHIEMARIASTLYIHNEHSNLVLKDVCWNDPVTIDELSKKINIVLYEQDNEEIEWEIYSEKDMDGEEYIVCSEGTVMTRESAESEKMEWNVIKEQYPISLYAQVVEEINSNLEVNSLIDNMWTTEKRDAGGSLQLLIRLNHSIPTLDEGYQHPVVIDPSLLKSCIQAIQVYRGKEWHDAKLLSMSEAEFIADSEVPRWGVIHVQQKGHDEPNMLEVDVTFYDDLGNTVSVLKGLRYGNTN
nr:beta-ketoacyl synthase N-terminal-like domain-containing protein [Ornithinibacillus scapharcae]